MSPTSMRLCFLLLLTTPHLLVGHRSPASEPLASTEEAAWSEEFNGLRARLTLRLSHKTNGTSIVYTYLELKNVSGVLGSIKVKADRKNLKLMVINKQWIDLKCIKAPSLAWFISHRRSFF